MLIEMAVVNNSAGYAQHRRQRQCSPGHSQQMDKTRCRHPVGFIFSTLLFLTQLERLASSYLLNTIRQLLAITVLIATRKSAEPAQILSEEQCLQADWGAYTRAGVQKIPVPGNHSSMMAAPHVAVLARRILDCLAHRKPPEASTLLDQEVEA